MVERRCPFMLYFCMKYRLILVIFIFILTACAGKQVSTPVIPLPLMKGADPIEIPSASPLEFEKSIPSSSILKKSLFVFENTYPRIYSDNGVLAVAAGQEMLAVLKEGVIEFTMPYCTSLVTKGDYNKIRVDGFIATVYSQSQIRLFSGKECAAFGTYKRLLRGEVAFLLGYVIEWEGSKVLLRDGQTSKVLVDGDMGLHIATVGTFGNMLLLVHSNGYVTRYDVDAKAFVFNDPFPIKFDFIYYSERMFYGINSETKNFFMISKMDYEFTQYKNCIISNTSPYALCGDRLVGFGKIYDGVPKSTFFTASGALFADLNAGNLNIYTLTNSWQRFLRLDYELPAPCLSADGSIYFNNFEGGVVKLFNEEQVAVEKRPDVCDVKSVAIKDGEFLCKGKPCGVFALKILSSGGDSMFRRIENGKRYYFFNDLITPDKVD